MSRLFLAVAGLVLVPALVMAEPVPLGSARKALPPSQYGEAKPAQCSTCAKGQGPIIPVQGYEYAGPYRYGTRLQSQLWLEDHECAPDGCPKPVGCGNFWTEKKFIFGSCRQFFGTAGSTYGTHRNAVER